MEPFLADIALPHGIVAFFTVRNGGVSDPPFHSLNLSVNAGDELDAVCENRVRLADRLPSEPMWLRQAHGSRVLSAESVMRDADIADAVYTACRGVVCIIQTADCLPVLLYHEDGAAVGTVHAGWRGLARGVLENTVVAMQAQNPSPLYACIGPSISAAHYVVGNDVYQALKSSGDGEGEFVPYSEEAGKWHADLPTIAERRLRTAGVVGVHRLGICTYAEHQLFFSARRDSGRTGRQAAVIYITP